MTEYKRLKEELKERLSELSEMYEGDAIIGARIEEVSKLLALIDDLEEADEPDSGSTPISSTEKLSKEE